MSKRFQMVGFKGPSQEKSPLDIFRFGYGKASNDKKVPDPVGYASLSSIICQRMTKGE